MNKTEERYYYLYCHTNKINGKKYIGISKQLPKIRWQNGNGYIQCKRFYSAIKKYGWDNFEHEILIYGLTQEEASQKEKEYIELFDTINNGYNMLGGGIDAQKENWSKPVNQYSLDKKLIKTWNSVMDVERLLGYQHSAITAVCRREHKTSHNYIWRYVEDCNDINTLVINKKNKYNNQHSLDRKINQYDLNGNFVKQWNNLLEIAHYFNKTTTVLFHCCERNPSYYSAYGYQWRYADDCDDISKCPTYRPIYELDENNNIIDTFEKEFHIKKKYLNERLNVTNVLKHRQKRTKGHIFVYADEYDKREK